MKAALKKKWIAALRSGKYKQGEGRLYDRSGAHCCLGVLRHCVTGKNRDNDRGIDTGKLLGTVFSRRVGLSLTEQQQLASLNDRGDSFSSISDWIKAHL